jgi:hypothetical protein
MYVYVLKLKVGDCTKKGCDRNRKERKGERERQRANDAHILELLATI